MTKMTKNDNKWQIYNIGFSSSYFILHVKDTNTGMRTGEYYGHAENELHLDAGLVSRR